MTDQELIKALREDAPRIGWLGWGRPNDVGKKMADAADRLEALLADNAALGREIDRQICKRSELEREIGRLEVQVEHLNAGKDTNVPTKWVSAEERLPEPSEKEKYWIEQLGSDFAPEFIVMVKGATAPTVLRFDGEKWFDDDNTWYRVAYWCNLPEPPSTEGVE